MAFPGIAAAAPFLSTGGGGLSDSGTAQSGAQSSVGDFTFGGFAPPEFNSSSSREMLVIAGLVIGAVGLGIALGRK